MWLEKEIVSMGQIKIPEVTSETVRDKGVAKPIGGQISVHCIDHVCCSRKNVQKVYTSEKRLQN